MATEKTYAIYWDPGHLQSGAASNIGSAFKSLIRRWFTDAQATGVYRNNSQYSSLGKTPTNTSWANAWRDTTAFPTGHCVNAVTGTNCITDADIEAVVLRQAAAHGITASPSKMFFVYTPKGEGSCVDSTCSSAAYTNYCAYHGSFTNGSGHLIYANMPWPTAPSSSYNCYYSPGGPQTFPNGNVNADASINVTSHEQNEAITDPLVNVVSAWYDSAGYENGDECAWTFAPTTTGGGDTYVNGHPYEVQMEGSNQAANCVISGPAGP